MLKTYCSHIYTVNQGQKLATVGCYIMVTLPRAQGTHVKGGIKVMYPKYHKQYAYALAHGRYIYRNSFVFVLLMKI